MIIKEHTIVIRDLHSKVTKLSLIMYYKHVLAQWIFNSKLQIRDPLEAYAKFLRTLEHENN